MFQVEEKKIPNHRDFFERLNETRNNSSSNGILLKITEIPFFFEKRS